MQMSLCTSLSPKLTTTCSNAKGYGEIGEEAPETESQLFLFLVVLQTADCLGSPPARLPI